MTLISVLLFITSTIGVLGFACWDNDIEIPILYSFGQFEAEWWFNDKLKPGRPHYEKHDLDGPPLVARSYAGGGGITFPYPASGVTANMSAAGTGLFTETYSESSKSQASYTPVNGLYGVTNQRESDRTLSTDYYPNAQEPSQYIVSRLLGPGFDMASLEDMGDKLGLYNKKVFKKGTPFKAAAIGGPGDPSNTEWKTRDGYQAPFSGMPFMPPLTSTGAGIVYNTVYGTSVARSVNDYSGAEYEPNDQSFAGSLEDVNVNGYRSPYVYQENKNAVAFDYDQNQIHAWPGEYESQYVPVGGGGTYRLQAAFHDSQFDGAAIQQGDGNVPYKTYGWGVDTDNPAQGGYYPKRIQKDYIQTQLAQENPIPSVKGVDIPKKEEPKAENIIPESS